MNFLQYDLSLQQGEVVEVSLDRAANVRLMDISNFHAFQQRRRHRFYGGQAVQSPVQLVAPHSGNWKLVIDLGGHAGTVHAGVRTYMC